MSLSDILLDGTPTTRFSIARDANKLLRSQLNIGDLLSVSGVPPERNWDSVLIGYRCDQQMKYAFHMPQKDGTWLGEFIWQNEDAIGEWYKVAILLRHRMGEMRIEADHIKDEPLVLNP